jgi:hypothetical protein
LTAELAILARPTLGWRQKRSRRVPRRRDFPRGRSRLRTCSEPRQAAASRAGAAAKQVFHVSLPYPRAEYSIRTDRRFLELKVAIHDSVREEIAKQSGSEL